MSLKNEKGGSCPQLTGGRKEWVINSGSMKEVMAKIEFVKKAVGEGHLSRVPCAEA